MNEEGFGDIIELSLKPIAAPHSNARKICDSPRNLSDDQIKVIADNRVIIEISFSNSMLSSYRNPGLSEILKHFNYIADIIGIDHSGLGAYYLGQVPIIPLKPGWLKEVYTGSSSKVSQRPERLSDMNCFPLITRGLLESGFSPEETTKILGKNYLRFFKEVLK